MMAFYPNTAYTPYSPPKPWGQPLPVARAAFTYPASQPVYPMIQTQPALAYHPPNPSQPLYHHPKQTPVASSPKQNHTSLWVAGGLTATATLGALAWLLTREKPEKSLQPAKQATDTKPVPSELDSPEAVEKPAPKPVFLSSEFQDPTYCDQVAFNIATESFPAVLKAIQNAPEIPQEVRERKSPPGASIEEHFTIEDAKHRMLLPQDDALEDTINQSVAKYLHPACKVQIGLFKDTEATGSSGLCTSSERGTLQSQGKFLSAIDIEGPVPQTDTQIQEWFTTYCHELRHMVDAATATSKVYVARKPDDPFGSDNPEQDQYCRLLSNRGHATDGYSDILYGILKRTYPECRDITFKDSYKKRNFTPEQLQHCWNSTNKLWQQTDKPMPMLTEAPENVRNFIPEWKKIFREGDPEVLASVMARVQDEMEAYRLCVKRAPSITPKLVENDLYDTAVFLFLRDLMRLYYQERGIPKEQQHPYTRPEYAKAHPLTLIP